MTNEEFKQYIEDHGANKALFKVTTPKQAQMALDAGDNVNWRGPSDWTPLMQAAMHGYTKITKLLIDNGANVNAMNNDGWTALIFAAVTGNTEIAKLLIDAMADVNAYDKKGHRVLFYATTDKMKELLRKHGATNYRFMQTMLGGYAKERY